METTARRVKAERDRQRLPQRSPLSRWSRRLVGLLATAAFVGVGVASALMIAPDSKGDGAAALALPVASATPTPAAKTAKPQPARHAGPSKAARAALADAQAQLRRNGFTTVDAAHYHAASTLRVLIGRPVGDAGGGLTAFFFLHRQLLTRDTQLPSTKLRVVRTSRTTVTLEYGTYAAGDKAPSGTATVRFQLSGAQVQPLDPIPAAGARFVRGAA